MSYIEKEALLLELQEELDFETPMYNEVENKWLNKGIRIALKDVKRFPTVDVVEVVKCEECKYCKMDGHWQMQYCTKMSDDLHTHWLPKGFYCGYGERREENEG